ncbi:MAG TPA: chemotaxis-specific protein-glutamate methyltransferase CheB [Caulobacteraceae bacterium]|jgi:two-component system chemotaxis response regulator CheB|nr:chemotaxis-specific protein-glutamate methyltransferase CheB [Caulobacteraceae bacterium]
MKKIRVLVVEDSLTVRKHLLGVLAADPDIEVIGEAEDGKRAIELCQKHRPDVITMDMMLPVMSGLAATEYIMAHCPTPILVVSSSVNRGELFKTYDALAAGAVDVFEKMNGTQTDGAWERDFVAAMKLVAKIRVITHPRGRLRGSSQAEFPSPEPLQPVAGSPFSAKLELVVIGASTGGPAAIVEVLRGLPPTFQLPVLFVMHINEPFGRAFADWLDGQTPRRVAYPKDGDPVALAAGRVVMAPGGHHLVVRDGRLRFTMDPERHSCRPSIDVLFDSVAREYGRSALACLLTGMGRDGAAGLLAIRKAGGVTIAQDEATSIIYGMPREAVLLGAADSVLPLGEIGPAIAAANEARG